MLVTSNTDHDEGIKKISLPAVLKYMIIAVITLLVYRTLEFNPLN